MKGRSDAARRSFEANMALAHQVEWFHRQERLKPVASYMPRRPGKRQSAAEMLDVLKQFKANGSNMKIRQIN
jgi:hypothetical protein